MFLSFLLLVIGFILLIKGADLFVEGASKIATKFHIPQIVIGLTIVAFGTSAPEAAISITSAINGSAGISIGNIIGSNIMNILLILGISALVGIIAVKKNTFQYEMPFVIIITLVFLGLGVWGDGISRLDGIILWGLFLVFLYYLYRISKYGQDTCLDDIPELDPKDTLIKIIVTTVIGIVFIVFGSDMTVEAATKIAKEFNVSDRIIGLTIVAFGTSLPELITSVTATKRGKSDIAVGNIIGSNIFNILFVVGTTALVSPMNIPFDSKFIFDSVVAVAAALLLWILSAKNKKLDKLAGVLLLFMYGIYFVIML